jgi:hypothetical protein
MRISELHVSRGNKKRTGFLRQSHSEMIILTEKQSKITSRHVHLWQVLGNQTIIKPPKNVIFIIDEDIIEVII